MWQPINSEPKDDSPRLVSEDPTDNESAYIARLTSDGKHFNGDVILEDMGIMPTHWCEIPVIDDEPEIAGQVHLRADNPWGLPEGMHNLIHLVKLSRTNDQAMCVLEFGG